jgi:hypothetical protein
LALWLAYFLLRRSWRGSLALGLALILFKEDAPLLVIAVAGMILTEDFVRSCGGAGPARAGRWNWPALTIMAVAAVAIPLLLAVIKSQHVAGTASNFARVSVGGPEAITGTGGLLLFVLKSPWTWVKSATVAGWLQWVLPASFGLLLLRPHLLPWGILTTATAWLVQEDWLWAARVVQSLAFFQLAAVLAAGSVLVLVVRWCGAGARLAAVGAMLALVAGGMLGARWQWRALPKTSEMYALAPQLPVEPAVRRQADAVFARYKQMARPGEPVVASRQLFRYANARDLHWWDRLQGRPQPEWILWDKQDQPLRQLWIALKAGAGAEPSDYRPVAREGRFLILRRKSAGQPAPAPPAVSLVGESHGGIRLKIRFPEAFATMAEPLLAIGAGNNGELFFVRYYEDGQFALGWTRGNRAVHLSDPQAYESGRLYQLELFSGALLPAQDEGDPGFDEVRRKYERVVSARLDGRQWLNFTAPPRSAAAAAELCLGINSAGASDVEAVFSGDIFAAQRGGYPELGDGALAGSEGGAVRLLVELPRTAAGVPEPLFTVGVPGDANLGYIRLLPQGRAQVGVEFWGHGVLESEPFPLPATGHVELVFELPSLYPPERDWRWGEVAPDRQRDLLGRVRVTVDGVRRLEKKALAPPPRHPGIFYGQNPLGGSWVSRNFTGVILESSRLSLDASPGEPH